MEVLVDSGRLLVPVRLSTGGKAIVPALFPRS